MKTLKVLYNKDTDFILNIANKFKDKVYLETYDANNYNQRGKVRVLQEDYGTKNLPLVIFEDENLHSIAAIWSENNPDWEKEIDNKIKKLI